MSQRPSKRMDENEKIRQAIDCCRSRDDLADLELQPLAQRLEGDDELERVMNRSLGVDAAIRHAFADVSCPAGLEERLLRRVHSASHEETEAGEIERVEAGNARQRSAFWTRKRWVASVFGVVAASFLVAFLLQFRAETASTDAVSSELSSWLLNAAGNEWNRDLAAASHRPSRLVNVRFRGWRDLTTSWDPQAVVFSGRTARGGEAMLFAIHGRADDSFPKSPPYRPTKSTGPWAMGTWVEQDSMIYVLAVQGDVEQYQSALQSTILAARPDNGSQPPLFFYVAQHGRNSALH